MEDYLQLEKIVTETVKHSMTTKNFDLGKFLRQMEDAFKNLGFRDNNERRGG